MRKPCKILDRFWFHAMKARKRVRLSSKVNHLNQESRQIPSGTVKIRVKINKYGQYDDQRVRGPSDGPARSSWRDHMPVAYDRNHVSWDFGS